MSTPRQSFDGEHAPLVPAAVPSPVLAEIERVSPSKKKAGICNGVVQEKNYVQASLYDASKIFKRHVTSSQLGINPGNLLSLFALMITDAEYENITLSKVDDFINGFHYNDYIGSGAHTNQEVDEPSYQRSELPRESIASNRSSWADISLASNPSHRVPSLTTEDPNQNETDIQKKIRKQWVAYFFVEQRKDKNSTILPLLIDLFLAYAELIRAEGSDVCGIIAIKYLFFKQTASLYGYQSRPLILTEAVDGIVLDESKLPKYLWWPDFKAVTNLFQRLSAQDLSNKPMVVIGMSGEQIQHLVGFPEESTGFALDIAHAIYEENQALANNICSFCGIDRSIISNLQTFSLLPSIHADISLALVALARENPQDFLTKTTEYIQLANIVYNCSLKNANTINFMANRGFDGNQSAPACYFITETTDRLVALYFTAVIYETIGDNEAFSMLRNYLHLMLCSHRSLGVDSIHYGVSSFEALKQQQDEMTAVMSSDDKINTTLSFFGQRGESLQNFVEKQNLSNV